MNLKTTSDWEWEYKKKQTEEHLKLIKEAQEGKIDPDIYNLKSILLSITPYSKWWRWGLYEIS